MPAADQSRARAGQSDRQPFRGIGPEQRFLDGAAGPHQHGPLPGLQLADLLLDVLGQRQVEIVAAEDQVVADGHAMELDFAPFAAADANQREIGRAAADVANQDLLARRHQPLPIVGVGVDPSVKGRLRLLDQHHPRQARPAPPP